MPWLTPYNRAGFITRSITIPVPFFPVIIGALLDAADPAYWQEFGDVTPIQAAAAVWEVIDSMESGNIGEIRATCCGVPSWGLLCDGSYYAKGEYLELYEAINPNLRDVGGFRVPDLRDRFMLGAANPGQLGDVGGEEKHTLSILEMPAHSHAVHGHLPIDASGEVPTPIPSVEFPIQSGGAGGGLPHNNMPPFYKLVYFVVAR